MRSIKLPVAFNNETPLDWPGLAVAVLQAVTQVAHEQAALPAQVALVQQKISLLLPPGCTGQTQFRAQADSFSRVMAARLRAEFGVGQFEIGIWHALQQPQLRLYGFD